MSYDQPYAGLKIVDISQGFAGPYCAGIFALYGAQVIKVEPPEGDKTRHLTGMGRAFFPTFNRGKKSITLNLKSDEGCTALHSLLATADVFVENFRDQTLAKMGAISELPRIRKLLKKKGLNNKTILKN